jgi:hypothetical protein
MPEAAKNFHLAPSRRLLTLAILLSIAVFCTTAWARPNKVEKPGSTPPVLRWDETHPGCTFTIGEDGKYRYGVWSGDLAVILAVDAREVQIVSHRIEPIFGVFLTVRYRGDSFVDLSADAITLQFVKHFKVVEKSLDPDDYTQKIQADADLIDDEGRRTITKRPQEKPAIEARLQKYQKSVSELIEFLGKNGLHPAHLDRGNPEASGWVFFNTNTKWIGRLKAEEEFLLRLPLDGKIIEFPFKLPPKAGELLLRKRE